MKNGIVILILISLFCVGCACTYNNGPVYDTLRSQFNYPPKYLLNGQSVGIVIERNYKTVGWANILPVTINGLESYRIANGERFTFDVNPGINYFGVIGRNSVTPSIKHHEIKIDCKPNKTYKLLVKYHFFIYPTIEIIEGNEDEKEITETRYIIQSIL